MAAALGLTMEHHIGPGASAILAAGVTPAAITTTGRIHHEWLQARLSRRVAAYDVAARASGREGDELAEVARSTPGMLDLIGSVGVTAEDARYRAKVEGLGRALAAALADPGPATMDAAFMQVAAIADLEPVHVRVLHLIAHGPPEGHPLRGGDTGDPTAMLLDASLFEGIIPGAGSYVGNIMAVLTRHYLVAVDDHPQHPYAAPRASDAKSCRCSDRARNYPPASTFSPYTRLTTERTTGTGQPLPGHVGNVTALEQPR